MPAMAQVPKDHPLMLAWEAHKQTEEYANSRKWAMNSQHVDGSLWALFEAGWRAAHLTQPAQAVAVGLVERLRKRVVEERQIAKNNARVAELLAPELARFEARDGHNIYATRMAIDHRNSAKRDATFADDLEAAIAALTATLPKDSNGAEGCDA